MRNFILSNLISIIKSILNLFFIRLDDCGTYFTSVPGEKARGKRAGFPVTDEVIKAHLFGQGHPIGSYCISKKNTCCVVMLDYDSEKSLKLEYLQGNPGPMLEEKKEILKNKVLPRCENLREFGISYLLEDSVGGYHLWIFLEPIPSNLAYEFAHSIDAECPEAFPKQPEIERWGNYVRLPGKYHSIAIGAKEEDWSKIWDGKEWVSTQEARAWEIVVATPRNSPEIIERWLAEKKKQTEINLTVVKNPAPVPARPQNVATHQPHFGDKVPYIPPEVVAQIKAFWTASRVFAHFGIYGEEKAERRDMRIKGHGGLTFLKDAPGIWYWFEKGAGGDQIDAWAYCRFGRKCNRFDKEEFKQILVEMAEAAGITIPSLEKFTDKEKVVDTPDVEKSSVEVKTPDVEGILALAEQWGATYKWEENPRTRATDRCTFFSILELMKKARKLEIPLGCRTLSDLTNYSHKTASNSLARSVKLGVITLVEESDGHNPTRYSLNLDFLRDDSARLELSIGENRLSNYTLITPVNQFPMPSIVNCVTRQSISPSNLGIFKSHDFFTWGSKLDKDLKLDKDPIEVIGRTSLEFISALVMEDDLLIKEIARRTGMNKETARRKGRLLEKLGFVTLTKVGRTVKVRLVGDWRLKLKDVWMRLKTYGRWQRRRVENTEARLEYAMKSLEYLSQGERDKLLLRIKQLKERQEREAAKLRRMMDELWAWIWDNLTEDQRERWAIMIEDGALSKKEALRYVKKMGKEYSGLESSE